MRAAGVLTATRVAAGAAGAVLLGLAVGVLGAFQHQRDADLLGSTVPAGLLLALVAIVLGQWLAVSLSGRAGVVLFTLTWLLVTTSLGTSRSEGDLVVAGDGRGTAYFWLGAVVCLAGGFAWSLVAVARSSGGAGGGARGGRP